MKKKMRLLAIPLALALLGAPSLAGAEAGAAETAATGVTAETGAAETTKTASAGATPAAEAKTAASATMATQGEAAASATPAPQSVAPSEPARDNRPGAVQRQPLRIAQMPTYVTAFYAPPANVMDSLDGLVDDALHIPLTKTLNATSFYPEDEVEDAFKDAAKDCGRGQYEAIARQMASDLDADLVVIPVVTRYEQYERLSWRLDDDRSMIRTSYTATRLYIYDAKNDKYIAKGAQRYYSDETSVQGSASLLVLECMDQSLREAQLKKLVTDETLGKIRH